MVCTVIGGLYACSVNGSVVILMSSSAFRMTILLNYGNRVAKKLLSCTSYIAASLVRARDRTYSGPNCCSAEKKKGGQIASVSTSTNAHMHIKNLVFQATTTLSKNNVWRVCAHTFGYYMLLGHYSVAQ